MCKSVKILILSFMISLCMVGCMAGGSDDDQMNSTNVTESADASEGKTSESEETGTTLVEQWVCDLETDEWTLLCIYDLKAKDVLFMSSPAIFMENYLTEYAGGVRSMEVRNAKYLDVSTDSWENVASAYISSNGGAPEYDGSYNFGTFQDRIWMIASGVGGDWYNNGKGRAEGELIFGD